MKRVTLLIMLGLLLSITATVIAETNSSCLNGVGVPYMVRRDIPGVADATIYRFDYQETHPLVKGEFDIKHYFKYDEVIYWMDRWAKEYPDIVDVFSIGKTYQGRETWMLEITNKNTGPATQKPAMWLGGSRHAGEVTAVVAAMDLAHKLISGYGTDPEITEMVDSNTYYILPMEDPDGSELYLNTVHRNRSTVRPYDLDGDGFADNDIEQDLNNDGLITSMRQYVGEGNGDYIIDPDDPSGRLMERVGDGKGDYLYWRYDEGLDVNNDGSINSDTVGGLDLHRNDFHAWRPMEEETGMGWTQRGSGEFPLSEPEIRNLVIFLLKNPNIAVAQTLHTAVPMVLRGPSTATTSESMFAMDANYVNYFDEKGLELTTYPWAGDTYETYASRRSWPELRHSPLFGHSLDWGYFQYGAIWYGDEMWGNGEYIKDFNNDGEVDDLDALWMKDNLPGFENIFIEWEPFEHPQLGSVEIGDWNYKFWRQNGPTALLADVVGKQTRFNFFLARSLPKLVFRNIEIKDNQDGSKTVTVTVANEGILPDALKQAYLIKIVRNNLASLELADGLSFADGSSKTQEIGFFAGELEDPGNDNLKDPGLWQRVREFSWTVKGSGNAVVTVRSTRGGTITRTIEIK